MMLALNAPLPGAPQSLGSPSTLAALLLTALQPDKLYARAQVVARFKQAGCSTPEEALAAALAVGWLREDPTDMISYCSRCWLPVQGTARPFVAPFTPTQFSYYRGPITNVRPYKDTTVRAIWRLIKGPTLASLTQRLRAHPVESAAFKALKMRLPCFTPAGTFTHRNAQALVTRSGLLVLDFDNVADLAGTRARLLADADLPIELLFISPSGKGLKVLVRVPLDLAHHANFQALTAYARARHGLSPDGSGADISRACFACHDAEAWIHPIYLPPPPAPC